MLSRFSLVVASILIAAIAGCASEPVRLTPNQLTEEEKAQGFELIFDGKNLDGWTGEWQVINGSMIPLADGQGGIRSVREWKNFHLKAGFYITGDKNSAIFFRCPLAERVFPRTCYEANIYDADPNNPTGSLLNIAPALQTVRSIGKWNTMEIIAVDSHIQILVNGVLTVDTNSDRFLEKGTISFQNSGGEGSLRFRSIKLLNLDPPESSE